MAGKRITPEMVTDMFDRMGAAFDAAQTRAYFVGVEVERDAALAEVQRLKWIIAEALTLCRTMDRGVGYRVSGDHSTWGEYTEGKSDFAGSIDELLAKVVQP